MENCTYSAVNKEGERVTGEMEAFGREDVASALVDKDLIVTKISCGVKPQDKSSVLQSKFTLIPPRITSEDVMVFTRELATMLNAGLPLMDSLFGLAEDIENPKMKEVVQDLGTKLIGGASFATALQDHDKVFDKMYINLVRVGEVGGSLEIILRSLASYIEASEALKKKVISAMYYPATVLTFAILVVSGLFIFIIPRFAEIYAGFGSELPGPTQVFLNISKFMQHYWLIVFGLILALIFIARRLVRTPKGGFWFDQFKLTLPMVGPLVKKIVIARFARTLSLLYAGGVPIVESMDLVATSCGNLVIEKALLDASAQVLEGEGIASTLEKSKIFPNMVLHMLDVGERSGKLSEMLGKVAEYYDSQVDSAINGLTTIIEPVLIVNMGVLIGLTAVCLFLPIVKLPTIINT